MGVPSLDFDEQKTPLEKKVALLYYGLRIPPAIVFQLQEGDEAWNWGRKGGAGPAGGRYFKLVNPRSSLDVLINISLQSQRALTSPLTVEKVEGSLWTITYQKRTFCTLELLPVPRFYEQQIEGHPATHYALLHGTDCLATTVNQRCIYWRAGQACQFCGIELSLNAGDTVEVKTPHHLLQVLELALKEMPITHVTLTIGTQPDDSRGIRSYLPLVNTLKQAYPNIMLHAQFEPPKGGTYIHELRVAGCDTAGIHVEILDDYLRQQYCPGKGHIRWQDYLQAWKEAVAEFGRSQVDSYILLGLEPLSELFLKRIKEMCDLGVVPYPVPVRQSPDARLMVLDVDLNKLVQVYEQIATLMRKSGVDPTATTAGCVRCAGCSAIGEAFSEELTKTNKSPCPYEF